MCLTAIGAWMAESAATIGAVGGALGGVAAIHNATKGNGPSAAEMQAAADARAAQNANGRLAQRKKALKGNSLLTGADVMSTGILNGGKPTLGG